MKTAVFSAAQLRAINRELRELWSNRSIGYAVGAPDITIMATDFSTDAFIKVVRSVADGDDVGRETDYLRITFAGETDRDPQRTMYFQNVADRMHFFASLYPVKYE